MQLTANFSLHELTKSETALRMGFDNTPGEAETEALRLLAEKVLQPVRDHFGKGVKVNSGFRSPEVMQPWADRRPQTIALGEQPILRYPESPTQTLRSGSWIT